MIAFTRVADPMKSRTDKGEYYDASGLYPAPKFEAAAVAELGKRILERIEQTGEELRFGSGTILAMMYEDDFVAGTGSPPREDMVFARGIDRWVSTDDTYATNTTAITLSDTVITSMQTRDDGAKPIGEIQVIKQLFDADDEILRAYLSYGIRSNRRVYLNGDMETTISSFDVILTPERRRAVNEALAPFVTSLGLTGIVPSEIEAPYTHYNMQDIPVGPDQLTPLLGAEFLGFGPLDAA